MPLPTILLVEDDDTLRYTVEAHLSGAGFAVIAVADAMAALRELDKTRMDLLVADVQLAGGGPQGVSLANMVRHRHGIPIIFMTGVRDLMDVTSNLPGTVMFKPVDLAALTAEIARLLDGAAGSPAPPTPAGRDAPERVRRYRMKAAALRTARDGMTDRQSRQNMQQASETYDKLADTAEARTQREKPKKPDAD
jgi:DNA-binding response OmpR family regulator